MEKIVALEDALEKKSLVGIYSVFYTVAHGDPNFSTGKFRQLLEYVKSKKIEGLFQEYDGEEFEPVEKWDENYWALIASSLVDNFCIERIDHLEQIGKKVYPVQRAEKVVPVQNDVISKNKRKLPNNVNKYKETRDHSKGLISDEQKKDVKNKHKEKKDRNGSFLNKLFGFK